MKLIGKSILGVVGLSVTIAAALMFWDGDHWRDYEPVSRHDYEIIRDEYGVPLIVGQNDPAIAYGVAMAQAADDFETIQYISLAVRRKLASREGRDGAKLDYISFLLNTREIAHRYYNDQLSPETRAWVEAYADGLNYFAKENPHRVLRKDIFPLTGEDVVANFVLMSPFFYGLDDVVGKLLAGEMPPGTPLPLTRGSNAFAIGPSRSSDGLTRLVSNSHQPWEGPVAWYELRVESAEGWRFYGVNFPCAPFPLMGHNDELGWTNTVNRPDLIDVYKLRLSADKKKYKFGTEWKNLEKRHEWLRVKIGPFTLPVRQNYYSSVHGPVIMNEQGAFALRYPGTDNIRQVEQYLKLTKAKNFEEWKSIMAMQAIPATNFIYADREGHIAHIYNAALPKRQPSYNWWEVLPGDDPEALWTEYVPATEIPQLIDPASGYIINANNTPFMTTAEGYNLKEEDYKSIIGIEPYTTNRIRRALHLFAEEEMTSAESLYRIKYDEGYDPTAKITQLMQQAMNLPAEGEIKDAILLLRQWDYAQDGIGPADTLAALLLDKLRMAGYQVVEPPELAPLVKASAEHLMTHYGRLDVPLAEFQRLRRGGVDMPVTGGPDALRAIMWTPEDDGSVTANFGDSFIMFVAWDENGVVESKSIQPFGSNVQDITSPHYNDQSVLFANKQLKDTGFVSRQPAWPAQGRTPN
ncbi:MAG: penicillin acylase family protein [bacterium]